MPLRISILVFIFCSSLTSFAQTGGIESALKNSKQKFKSIDELVAFITSNADNDFEKAQGVYYWIANNVRYDVKKFLKDKPSNYEPDKVFTKKLAVCAGYSNLFRELCLRLNLPCEMVSGYSKGYTYVSGKPLGEADHAWNAVKIDSGWALVDVTWGSGYIKKGLFRKKFKRKVTEKYFNVAAGDLVIDHLPEVPMWQLLNYPVSVKTFSSTEEKIKNFLAHPKAPYFNYRDSIKNHLLIPVKKREIAYGYKAVRFNPGNTTPLAFSMMLSLLDTIRNSPEFYTSSLSFVDSLIGVTDRAIELLKKSKTSRQSVKEFVGKRIDDSHEVEAELYLCRSEACRRKCIDIVSSADSLRDFSNQTLEATERGLRAANVSGNKKTIRSAGDLLCGHYLYFFDRFTNLYEKETDLKKKRALQKEISLLLHRIKKNIMVQSECYKTVSKLEVPK
jgi:hypothetical protein